MNSQRFYKMQGSGNDFVFLDGREHRLEDWPVERIRQVTDRRLGVGGDGVVHLVQTGPASIRMIYFNADGSRVDMCGNAALCATRLAARLGLIEAGRDIALDADAGRYHSRTVGSGADAELAFSTVAAPLPLDIELFAGEQRAFFGTVGVPHVIILVDDISAVSVVERGRQLRYADRFAPEGTNVNFIGPVDGPDAGWALRTYERGVEAETLACGTGTVASALALAAAGMLTLPVRVRSSSGAVYAIDGHLDGGQAHDLWLRGPGQLVFVGNWTDGSTDAPA
ncbi:MAG: diaminopimelate epimerase [Gemmatimonadales bacterium]